MIYMLAYMVIFCLSNLREGDVFILIKGIRYGRGENMVVEIAVGYMLNAVLQNLVIPEIGRIFAGKAAKKGAELKDIEGPEWLQKIGKWFDDHSVSTPEAVKRILNEHQERIIEALKHEGELKDDLGRQILESVHKLKDRIDNAQLTNEDKEFLAEIKKNFDPDEFEKTLKGILKENAGVDQQLLHGELTTFFENMGWDDKLDVINSKLDRVLEEIEAGITDIQQGLEEMKINLIDIKGTIERIPKSELIEIEYPPDPPPPDVSGFVDREKHLGDLSNSLDAKNMIVIQGIPGIGKTQLAAKLKQTIENDYKTFWMQLEGKSTLYSVANNLAGFLRENGNVELADYIRNRGFNRGTIISKLLSGLDNKNYVLFFDDYHKVKNEEIHQLFRLFKDQRISSTIVVTTREQPPFISQIDRIKKKVKERDMEGFDADATRTYLEQMGVEVSEKQLIKICKRMAGHPQLLELFAGYVLDQDMEVDDVLDDLTEEDLIEELWDKIYKGLDDDTQRRILKALSIFRRAVPSEACVYVAQDENVKETLKRLEEKKLVKHLVKKTERRTERLFYLHDVIKELAKKYVGEPKVLHRHAGEYYAQLEKTPENIQETTYHMIEDMGSVTDEVVKYLVGTTQDSDPFTCFTVLEVLKEKKITSPLIFELLDEFSSAQDSTIQRLFINEYGNFFEKLWRIDHKKSIDVLRHFLDHADPSLLLILSSAVAKITCEVPNEAKEAVQDEACKLWEEIIKRGDTRVRVYVSYHIIYDAVYDANFNPQKAASVLKYLIESSEESKDLVNAKNWLKIHKLMETEEEKSCEVYLENLKNMSIDEKLQYIWEIKDKAATPADFVIETLNNIYDQDRDQVAQLLKRLIKNYYKYQTVMQRIPRLIAKLAQKEKDIDLKYLEIFLNENEDNVYIKYAGIRALDLIKDKIGPERAHLLFEPLKADNSPVIRQLALIMGEEIESSSRSVDLMSRLKRLDPKRIIKISYGISRLKSELSVTEDDDKYLFFLMSCWCLLKASEGTNLELILNILKPFNKYDDENLKEVYRLIGSISQKNPAMVLRIANYAFSRGMKDLESISIEEQETLDESEIRIKEELRGVQQKMSALWVICNVGNRAPLKAKKYLESLIKLKDYPAVDANSILFFLSCLMDIRDALPDDTEKFFQEFSTHQDGNVRGFAKLLLKGV